MSWETHIKQQVETLTIEQLQEYFKKKYRGRFYVDMKRLVAVGLRSEGMTYQKIASIIYGDKNKHDTVILSIKLFKINNCDKRVEQNFIEWIEKGIYPISVKRNRKPKTEYEKAICEKFGVNQINYLDFKLKKKWRFLKN